MKKRNGVVFFAMLLTLLNAAVYAEDAAAPAGAPAMDPAMAAKMAEMQALTSPGEAHKVLEAFVGTWNYTGNFWMNPGDPATPMTGTMVNSMDFNGRFLKQVIEGPWMGQTFHGLGYTGYDSIRKEYVSTWLDDMSTSIMTSAGQYDAAAKTLTQTGANSCPLTGETHRKGRSTWTVNDANTNTYTSYSTAPDGSEHKMMELVYTRAV